MTDDYVDEPGRGPDGVRGPDGFRVSDEAWAETVLAMDAAFFDRRARPWWKKVLGLR